MLWVKGGAYMATVTLKVAKTKGAEKNVVKVRDKITKTDFHIIGAKIGDVLKAQRMALGMTVADVAKEAKIGIATVYKRENNEYVIGAKASEGTVRCLRKHMNAIEISLMGVYE